VNGVWRGLEKGGVEPIRQGKQRGASLEAYGDSPKFPTKNDSSEGNRIVQDPKHGKNVQARRKGRKQTFGQGGTGKNKYDGGGGGPVWWKSKSNAPADIKKETGKPGLTTTAGTCMGKGKQTDWTKKDLKKRQVTPFLHENQRNVRKKKVRSRVKRTECTAAKRKRQARRPAAKGGKAELVR